jgi:aminopeptidase N
VSDVAGDFTEQPGVPLISVASGECTADGRLTLKLSQDRFGVDPESQRPLVWRIPVSAVVVGSAGAAGEALVTGPEAISRTLPACGPVKINARQTAYFRSAYSQPDFNALADHFATLGPADQLGMFYAHPRWVRPEPRRWRIFSNCRAG